MENLHLKSFLEYKFLSNLDFNPEGKNLSVLVKVIMKKIHINTISIL